jgi:hypothetical protein
MERTWREEKGYLHNIAEQLMMYTSEVDRTLCGASTEKKISNNHQVFESNSM